MSVSLKETISKTTMATIVSAIIVLAGIAYFIWIRNTDGVMFVTGAGIGYLFKELKKT